MRLDALVYKNKKNLPFDPEALGASFNPETGEYFFEDPDLDPPYADDLLVAIAKHLGNITAIGHLREELSEVLEAKSAVLSKVIYSGTHSGDWLALDAIPELEWELFLIDDYLRKRSSPLVSKFVTDMRELASAARDQGNPIVF